MFIDIPFSNIRQLVAAIYRIYPAPANLSYWWNYGIYSFVSLIIQILTGIFLAMHYVADIDLAFNSVEHIIRDVNYGWLLRYIHANGASIFFIVVYLHTFRGLYFGSYVYPRRSVWIIGVVILFVIIITAFIGYVLPWGQMSFWGATVITNLISALPFVGEPTVYWIWGGYSVDKPTLTRFFAFHYLFPFVILALVMVHLVLLHNVGSSNPMGIEYGLDSSAFAPYFIWKDLFGLLLYAMFFSILIFFAPNYLGHSDNYIPANPLVTPAHIVPEWYFLPFYAILRAVPDKLLGVVALLFAIFSLFVLPYIVNPHFRSSYFRPLTHFCFWIFIVACLYLCFLGGKPASYPYTYLSQITTILYFSYFFILLPIIVFLENWVGGFYITNLSVFKKRPITKTTDSIKFNVLKRK
jgi:ubiquinol-cytochrome c reductase cytochrome b subunit